MRKLFIPLILTIGLCINANAQEKSKRELKGDKLTFDYSYSKAIVVYESAKQLSPEGQRRLAESYYNINLPAQSEAVYAKLISAGIRVTPEDYYNYAMVLKANGKYLEAGIWMDKFSENNPGDLRSRHYQANKAVLPDLLQDKGKYKIEHLTMNTNSEDFGATYYKNEVVYSSSWHATRFILRLYNWTQKPFWDMYVSEVDGGQLKHPKPFNRKLNGKLHDGPACFSNNGTYMAFTRNNYHDKTKDRVVELQIFFSTNTDGKWTKPEPFILNSKDYSVGQPSLTSDGNTMYFTSDMPGGFGGADIYRISKLNSGMWGKPENLGEKINTEKDEMFPFIEENNQVLFFTSNGHYGLGGLDIYHCAIIGAEFGPVLNAGYPVNTQYNDFAMIMDRNMSNGYFTSDRTGGNGGDDIYSFEVIKDPAIDNNLTADVNDTLLIPMINTSNTSFSFFVTSPANIPTERMIREFFPIRNYVFFDLGSTEIPDRFVMLKKEQVADFKEDQLDMFVPKNLSGRSERQLIIYYNILNILADRMGKNPSTTITLIGSSELGPDDGLIMAENVRQYLVTVFGIEGSRISIEGRDKPKLPSEQPDRTTELTLRRECDRRVSIESSSPILLMEYQNGSDAPLKPVEIVSIQNAPLDSYVAFIAIGGKEAFSSWSMQIKDEDGGVLYYGPYFQENVGIPGKSILGTRPEGDYDITMTGSYEDGTIVMMDTTVHMVLWTPPQNEEVMRFSILYEFNDSEAIKLYERYLTDFVLPKIPEKGKVIIHGHTDIIGEEAYNQKLSLARANDVKRIMQDGLAKAGRKDVSFKVFGFGEDQNSSPFENGSPEERFYNRTVIIDIIPEEKAF